MKPGVGAVYESSRSSTWAGRREGGGVEGNGGESRRKEKGNMRYESKAKQTRTGI
jgi:hypothetical protein